VIRNIKLQIKQKQHPYLVHNENERLHNKSYFFNNSRYGLDYNLSNYLT
jgi:hypothetical protein